MGDLRGCEFFLSAEFYRVSALRFCFFVAWSWSVTGGSWLVAGFSRHDLVTKCLVVPSRLYLVCHHGVQVPEVTEAVEVVRKHVPQRLRFRFDESTYAKLRQSSIAAFGVGELRDASPL